MNTKDLEEKFNNMHLLDRDERTRLTRDLETFKPEFMKPFSPSWSQYEPCIINVLIVCDGNLNFHIRDFGLSEFLTTFNKLEAQSLGNVNYKVTIAHRQNLIVSPNPVVVGYLPFFKFTNVDLKKFDQIWLFAFNPLLNTVPDGSILPEEINAIEKYMNDGGGVFGAGDHGLLGSAMCGKIPRIKDMRYWSDTSSDNDLNEVSMTGRRRNDTNTHHSDESYAGTFNHQSDNVPQRIAVRIFANGKPHPLLSISPHMRPSETIDIMPDHPHEGECAPETTFTVNGIAIPTQIIATSIVHGGNTSGGKTPTTPHCFPSISVFDGRPANAGRIVVDSTWHHFVNINLNGAGHPELSGLDDADFEVIRQYYMNIATWITRRKPMICLYKRILFGLLKDSQLVESTLNNPDQKLEEISLTDLNSIGALAEEILAGRYNPVFARTIFLELFEDYHPELADIMNFWKGEIRDKKQAVNEYNQHWLNLDLILRTSIGAGFIALRDDAQIGSEEVREKSLDKIWDVFAEGLDFGFNAAVRNLNSNLNRLTRVLNDRKSE